MQVISTNVGSAEDNPGPRYPRTGINKQPVDVLHLAIPGPHYGDGSGVQGDFVGDNEHHGGADKAVYAYSREELDYWSARLGRTLANGSFGDNLTTRGIDLKQLVINQRVRIGSAVVEVSVPRTPCATFAAWMGEKGWLKSWSERADCGCYFRIIEPGDIRPGDAIELGPAPDHGVTMTEAFRAKMGDVDVAHKVVAAQCLPAHHHNAVLKRIEVAEEHAAIRTARSTTRS